MGTRWRPNTCGCELDFVDGPKQPPTHITRCPEHLEDDGRVVWDENQGLNRTLKVLQETRGIAPEAVLWTFTRVSPTGRRHLDVIVPSSLAPVDDLQAQLAPGDQGHVRISQEDSAPRGLSPGGRPEVIS